MSSAVKTEQFLKCLSTHLSGRAECRGVSYICTIYTTTERRRQLDIRDILGDTSTCKIVFHPNIAVYPDIHKRHDSSKCSVVEHVLKYHFPEIYKGVDIMGDYCVASNCFVPGVYMYELSVTGRHRRWTSKLLNR